MKCTCECKAKMDKQKLTLRVISTWASVAAEHHPDSSELLLDIANKANEALYGKGKP